MLLNKIHYVIYKKENNLVYKKFETYENFADKSK